MAFFEYYARDEPDSNEAWRLKDLQTMPMMVGQVVEYIVAKTLEAYLKSGEVKSDLAKYGRRWYRRAINESEAIIPKMRLQPRTKQERDASEFHPLHDHYHNLDLGEEYRQVMEDRVAKCLENFEKGEVWQKLQHIGVGSWGPITKLSNEIPSFTFEGTRVYSSFDMWIKDEGAVVILDWKTGTASPMAKESADGQLAVYALYAATKMKQKREIKTQAIWLSASSDYDPRPISDQAIESVKSTIAREVAEELSKVQVVEFSNGRRKYIANREHFPSNPQPKKCTECKYRTICEEGKSITAHLHMRSEIVTSANSFSQASGA